MENPTNKQSLSISAWNVHGLGEKTKDEFFLCKIKSDINILLETWKGECKDNNILGYNCISKSRKKKRKAKRHSGGIIIYYRKEYEKGITHIVNGTNSQNRLWLKLSKEFFGFQENVYLCAVYVPPVTSNYFENDLNLLENEISSFSNSGKVILMGDFNARTGQNPDFIMRDNSKINNFDASHLLPEYYEVDSEIGRNNQDTCFNAQGKSLLDLCISSRLRILNGRYIGDSLGYYTFMSLNGYSSVDYALVSESLLSSVKFFKTDEFNYLSDHVQIQLTLKCSIKNLVNINFEKKGWKEIKRYKWTSNSEKLLINALSSEQIKNDILDFEIQNFEENQEGVDGAVENLNKILNKISENSCRLLRKPKKTKKYKQVWSDETVYESKREINSIGNKLKKCPNSNLKHKYFELLKSFKKMVKQKKMQYRQNIYNSLTDTFNKKPKDYWEIIKSLKGKKNEENDIPEILNDENIIINHIQNQGKPAKVNELFAKELEEKLNDIEKNIEFNEKTDAPITCSEIKKVIYNLKKGKSPGPDNIINEIIKYSKNVTIKSIAKLFNIILNSGIYPSMWKKSFVILLHKSGEKCDPNNYRGISLISCLPKLFNAILNERLINLMETTISKSQFGFRKNHRTSDSIFVLKALINKYLHKNKKKIFACFVDLRKAFDSVWRKALLFKLCNMEVGNKFFHIIKQQYSETISAVKYQNLHSEYFSTSRGVKQGDSLSPTLFNLFINDIDKEFMNRENHPLELINSKVGCLLFADDLLILSESKEGLQNSINNLSKYCYNWQLTINVKKTKTMIFQRVDSKHEKSIATYETENLTNVSEYTFLGIQVKSNGDLKHSSEELVNKAKKVLFAIKSYAGSMNNMPIKVACSLFDTMVKPIATYNSEVTYMDTYISLFRAKQRANLSGKEIDYLYFSDKSCIEKIHLSFCKYILGTKKTSSNFAVRTELARYPLEMQIKIQSLLLLVRLLNSTVNPILHESFLLAKSLDSEGCYTWFTYVKNIAMEAKIELTQLHGHKNKTQLVSIKKELKLQFLNFYKSVYNQKLEKIDNSSKLYFYKTIKQNLEKECYLDSQNFEKRRNITKLRISDHNLLIEKGRYLKIPRENRLCLQCNLIEDEKHFLLYCTKNINVRNIFIEKIMAKEHIFNFNYLSEIEKMKIVLSPSTPQQVENAGSYIKQLLELRTGDS